MHKPSKIPIRTMAFWSFSLLELYYCREREIILHIITENILTGHARPVNGRNAIHQPFGVSQSQWLCHISSSFHHLRHLIATKQLLSKRHPDTQIEGLDASSCPHPVNGRLQQGDTKAGASIQVVVIVLFLTV